MTIKESITTGTIVDVTEHSKAVWPGLQVYFSQELFSFMALAQEYAASLEQVIQDLLEDIDYRIDIELLGHDTDHLLEVMVGEIPGWFMVVRKIGVRQVLLANPHDDVTQMEFD